VGKYDNLNEKEFVLDLNSIPYGKEASTGVLRYIFGSRKIERYIYTYFIQSRRGHLLFSVEKKEMQNEILLFQIS
jgi:hypothetical protein